MESYDDKYSLDFHKSGDESFVEASERAMSEKDVYRERVETVDFYDPSQPDSELPPTYIKYFEEAGPLPPAYHTFGLISPTNRSLTAEQVKDGLEQFGYLENVSLYATDDHLGYFAVNIEEDPVYTTYQFSFLPTAEHVLETVPEMVEQVVDAIDPENRINRLDLAGDSEGRILGDYIDIGRLVEAYEAIRDADGCTGEIRAEGGFHPSDNWMGPSGKSFAYQDGLLEIQLAEIPKEFNDKAEKAEEWARENANIPTEWDGTIVLK